MCGQIKIKKENKYILAIGIGILIMGFLSLFCRLSMWVSLSFITIINLYLLSLLIIATVLSDEKDWLPVGVVLIIPSRVVGLILFFIILASFILLFGAVYLKLGEIGKTTISNPFEAIYFSTLTTTTLGFGDISKNSNWPKGIMLYQVISSVHLFLGSFPLLLSRITKI